MSDVDEVLERVREYRAAARLVVETDVSFKHRCLGLLDIVDMARKEPNPLVVRWAEAAIWEEAKGFLGLDDAEPELPNPSFEHRVRGLRREGYVACPTCLNGLPTGEDLQRWARQRRHYAELLEARERAVDA